MSIFRIFGGKSAAEHEQKGDGRAARKDWGRAKISYDSALDKLEKSTSKDTEAIARLEEKIGGCLEALASQHQRDAEEMVEGGAHFEARELVLLALELSVDPQQRSRLQRLFEDIEQVLDAESEDRAPLLSYQEPDGTREVEESEVEYFQALIATLPEDVQQAYQSYGENFETGYLALNEGDFETAADYLARAMDDTPSPASYIPLELATAYLNLGHRADARQLLEGFIEDRSDALPAYQMLCEIYWESGEFHRADELLASVPVPLSESVAVYLLKGETLFQAGDGENAAALYRQFLQDYGWNEAVARALAAIHEARSEVAEARGLYGEMMKRCSGCGSRVDPMIKQKYADLCFASGEHTSAVLETYLALAQEVPQLAADNYEKVSRIYAAKGNTTEERRFRSFALRARQDSSRGGSL